MGVLTRKTGDILRAERMLRIALAFYLANAFLSVALFFVNTASTIAVKIAYTALCFASLVIYIISKKAFEDMAYDSFVKLGLVAGVLGIPFAFGLGGALTLYARSILLKAIKR